MRFSMAVSLPLAFCACLSVTAAPVATNGAATVSPVQNADGHCTGFRLADAAGEVAVVRFGSLDNIVARKLVVTQDGLEFSDFLSLPTPPLDRDTRIAVRLLPGSPYPEVDFRLGLGAFDQAAWEQANGEVPFHFLACSLPGAEVFYQRGWPIGTPVVEEYPIRGEFNAGHTCGSYWSRDWSSAPPLGAYPMPAVGLWRKSARRFVAYDFNGARLTDHSEKDIATAYAYRHRTAAEFFCLVWPFARNYQYLRYPEKPATVASRFRLLFSREIGGDDDPSLFLQEWLWSTYRDLLPGVPAMNDLSWLPGGCRLTGFGRPGLGRLYGVDNGPFFTPGSITATGIGYDPNSAVDYAYRQGDRKALEQLRQDIDYLLPRATRLTIEGDECCFWQYPLSGDGPRMFGPGVPTLHTCWGWGVAHALLETWRGENTAVGKAPPPGATSQEARLLPYIDGALRYTKHILYTRNDYPDVPAAQFAWGAAPACTFCLRYYYTFRDDPERRDLAALAYKLARSLLYRYLAIWPSDNDELDNLDSSFCMEPNAGYPWLGAACSNEAWVFTFALAEVYAATGDPILGHYLRGQLDTWHQLYKDTYAPTMAAYATDALTERYGFYDEAAQARGTRADFGGLWGGTEALVWPVGSAVARVLCGEKAAMAFNRDGLHTDIAEYRCYGGGSVSFRLVRQEAAGPADLTVSFPFFDLRGKPVETVGADGQKRALTEGNGVRSWDTRPDSINVAGVSGGEIVVIGGTYDPAQPVLKCPVEKVRELPKGDVIGRMPGFSVLNLAAAAQTPVRCDWNEPTSYAGLPAGFRSVFGVPFYIVGPELNGGRSAVRDGRVGVGRSGQYLFALVGKRDAAARLRLLGKDGTETAAPLEEALPVLRGWPPLFEWELSLVAVKLEGREVAGVAAEGVDLFALTVCQRPEPELAPTFAALDRLRQKLVAEREAEQKLRELRPLFERFAGHIALLSSPSPDGARGQIAKALQKADLMRFVEVVSQEQVGQPARFSAGRYWVVLYCGGEDYVVGNQDTYDAGLQRFLAGGGTLIALPSMPFPFYYANSKPVVSAGKFGLPICGSGADRRPDRIEAAGLSGWEKPPANKALTFRLNPDQTLLTGLPAEFPFPGPDSGLDPRWRPIANVLPEGDVYVPLITLYDQDGKSYGDGAAWLEHRSGPLAGARELYVWCSLTGNPALQTQIVTQAIGNVLRQTLPPPAEHVVLRCDRAPAVDGILDDPVWRQAEALAGFAAFIGGKDGKPARATEAKLAWDNEYLYVAFSCVQEDIWGDKTARDSFVFEENVVEVYLDPAGLGKDYKEFEVSPLNTRLDLNIPGAGNGAPLGEVGQMATWDSPGWQTAVHVDGELNRGKANGWTVEMAIPFRDLGLPGGSPRIGDVWRANLYRIDRSGTRDAKGPFEASAWSPTTTFHAPEHFGRLIFGGNACHDDFRGYPAGSNGAPTWTIGAGTWRVEDGRLIGENSGSDGWLATGAGIGSASWQDYRLQVNFQVLSTGRDHRDGPWIAFRHRDDRNSYSLNLGGGRVQLHKVAAGTSTGDELQLADVAWANDGAAHTVAIDARGNHIAVQLDGKPIMDVTDTEFNGVPGIDRGGVVLSARKWTGSTGTTRVAFWGYDVSLER
jgi:hypothetical protein